MPPLAALAPPPSPAQPLRSKTSASVLVFGYVTLNAFSETKRGATLLHM